MVDTGWVTNMVNILLTLLQLVFAIASVCWLTELVDGKNCRKPLAIPSNYRGYPINLCDFRNIFPVEDLLETQVSSGISHQTLVIDPFSYGFSHQTLVIDPLNLPFLRLWSRPTLVASKQTPPASMRRCGLIILQCLLVDTGGYSSVVGILIAITISHLSSLSYLYHLSSHLSSLLYHLSSHLIQFSSHLFFWVFVPSTNTTTAISRSSCYAVRRTWSKQLWNWVPWR